jgi:hypothetical protein
VIAARSWATSPGVEAGVGVVHCSDPNPDPPDEVPIPSLVALLDDAAVPPDA